MDRFCNTFPAVRDADLMISEVAGMAWAVDLTPRIEYGEAYFEKCAGYDPVIAQAVTDSRIRFVARHWIGAVLDVGIGAGHFVQRRCNTFGWDINPAAVAWLREWGLYAERFDVFRAFTFWDVLEHVPAPQTYLDRLAVGSMLFVSLPIFGSLWQIRESKHYRPGEHLYYFTQSGLVAWLARYGFELLEVSDHETRAGRESILAFAFARVRPCLGVQ